ncbi:hypothetical protein GY45DRAFT_1360397 [Cubamyces sp. BRFM 1775]|nr:hypothetical protein GY45DRAFT_1360397 [Cubamyces sp. BRFM 1775]
MRPFILLAVLAGITAVYAYPRGLKSRQYPSSLELPVCSVPCLTLISPNPGDSAECIANVTNGSSDKCICDEVNHDELNFWNCASRYCTASEEEDLYAYLRQTCLGMITDHASPPRARDVDDLVPNAGASNGELISGLPGESTIGGDLLSGSLEDLLDDDTDNVLDGDAPSFKVRRSRGLVPAAPGRLSLTVIL